MKPNKGKASKVCVSAIVTISVVAVVVFGLFPAAAGPGEDEAAVSGTVTDARTGKPIEGALVVITHHDSEMPARTDEEGRYSFEYIPMCFCLKTITASKDSYIPESRELAISGAMVVDFELEMDEQPPEAEGTVRGMVMDAETGDPIAGALVVVNHEGVVVAEAYTGERGEYTLSGIPLCFCLKEISVSADGYASQETSIAVDEDTVMDFFLDPEGGDEKVVPLPEYKEDPEPGPRIVVGFPGAGSVPERISEHPVATSGLVGASVALLAAGLYATIVKQ